MKLLAPFFINNFPACDSELQPEFYVKLVISVQDFDNMNKLRDRYIRLALGKLPYIRADFVRLDNNGLEWYFTQLVNSIGKWTDSYKSDKFFKQKNKMKSPVHVFNVKTRS